LVQLKQSEKLPICNQFSELLQNCVLKIKSEKVVVEKEAAKIKHENAILKKNIEPSFQVNPLPSVRGHLTHDECQQKLHLLSLEQT
jgi:hypothetical protein